MSVPALPSVSQRLADELAVSQSQVSATVALLDGGMTVPFVARYRKEATGGLDDTQLRNLEERLRYLRELDERREAIRVSIQEAGKLTEELHTALLTAQTKARLEDIYAPYKPKRRTKAQIAREAGLEPLALDLLANPSLNPQQHAEGFVGEQVPDVEAALQGARAIVIEHLAEDADLIGQLREYFWTHGQLRAQVKDGKEHEGAKFSDYFDHREALTSLPSHRVLAIFRAEKLGVLTVSIDASPADDDDLLIGQPSTYEVAIAEHFGIRDAGRPADRWLLDTVRRAWRARISISLEVDMRMRLLEHAESAATGVFATNLRDLLLASPAGGRATLGLDPGLRTGVKVAVVDGTGKVVDTGVVYPHKPKADWDRSLATLRALVLKHQVELIAIGNGTASRETEALAREVAAACPGRSVTPVVVSEAGASVYSASEYAARELPELDVTLRGAVSIARRLQDPLAELVKIEPMSIGVGQYQHDLPQGALARALDAVVEDCVNAVGVEVNTASVPLLTRVAGVGPTLAESIVSYREEHGPFRTRKELTQVPRLGPKAFQQCAGFLRIRGGDDPLDASAVHPEAYRLVQQIAASATITKADLIGNSRVLAGVRPLDFVTEQFGLPTVTDVLAELDKPGRDPRPSFRTATFTEGVTDLEHVTSGMIMEGTVTNVAAFGAFVDVGVHQDGLVHVSAMADHFISDPREVVKPGDIVRVKVLSVDVPRRRISLSLRLDDPAGPGETNRRADGETRQGRPGPNSGRGDRARQDAGSRDGGGRSGRTRQRGSSSGAPSTAMADALRRAGLLDR